MQFTEDKSQEEILNFVKCTSGFKYSEKQELVFCIVTLEGTMFASLGDWIIKGVNGEFYPCKPDIF